MLSDAEIIALAKEAGFAERHGIVRTMHSSGAWVGINEEITAFARAIEAAVLEKMKQQKPDTRCKVKLGSQYGSDLSGHWFYLHPADKYAEVAMTKHSWIAAPVQQEKQK